MIRVRGRLAALLVSALLVGLAGCTTVSQGPPPPRASQSAGPLPSGSPHSLGGTLSALGSALRAHDRDGFLALTSTRDAGFAGPAQRLYASLAALPLTRLDFRADAQLRPLSAQRQQVLGPDGWAQQVIVTWQLTGDRTPLQHRLWLTFVHGRSGVELAGTTDGPPQSRRDPLPGWWIGREQARIVGDLTVLTGTGQPLDRWIGLLSAAVRDAREALPPPLVPAGRTSVVVEVAASTTQFESILGVAPGSYDGIAAVTGPAGIGDRAPIRIVVNPQAGELPGGQSAAVLEHEMVHVLTGSPHSAAPQWATEGLADWVAYRTHDLPPPGLAELLTQVRAHGAPAALPAEADFEAPAAELNRTYAESLTVCRYVAESYSVDDLGRLHAALSAGRSLDRAAGDVLGVNARQFVAGWRSWLVKAAR